MLRRLIKSIAKQISHLDNVTAMANFYRDRPAACGAEKHEQKLAAKLDRHASKINQIAGVMQLIKSHENTLATSTALISSG